MIHHPACPARHGHPECACPTPARGRELAALAAAAHVSQTRRRPGAHWIRARLSGRA